MDSWNGSNDKGEAIWKINNLAQDRDEIKDISHIWEQWTTSFKMLLSQMFSLLFK